mmetsp:Transcript_75444/g.208225  ORF Transcript_75444/g.208225 Transcript_75444/m.208225 type:complete len:201 (+) Transcript_75444:385-987(+)
MATSLCPRSPRLGFQRHGHTSWHRTSHPRRPPVPARCAGLPCAAPCAAPCASRQAGGVRVSPTRSPSRCPPPCARCASPSPLPPAAAVAASAVAAAAFVRQRRPGTGACLPSPSTQPSTQPIAHATLSMRVASCHGARPVFTGRAVSVHAAQGAAWRTACARNVRTLLRRMRCGPPTALACLTRAHLTSSPHEPALTGPP